LGNTNGYGLNGIWTDALRLMDTKRLKINNRIMAEILYKNMSYPTKAFLIRPFLGSSVFNKYLEKARNLNSENRDF
jgi:hypothetical protein